MKLRQFVMCGLLALTSVGRAAAQPVTVAAEAASPEPDVEDVSLALGETRLVSAKNVRNYSEGSGGVISVKLTSDGSQFVLQALRPGSTSMLLIMNDGSQKRYNVNVFTRPPELVQSELEQLLRGLPGVHVRSIGARNVIDGVVQDAAELARVERVAALYPGQVESLVRTGTLEIEAPPEAGGPGRRLPIRIDFYFVQLDASSSYAVGLGWPRSIGGPGAGQLSAGYDFLTRSVTQAALTVNQPLPQLDMAAEHGWGKVLRHATIITNSGAEATFHNGGEQNYAVNTGFTASLQSIPFGIEVIVVPRFDAARRDIELKIRANISDLTAPGAATNVPGRTTSRLTTVVNARLGQAVVLSGIRSSTETHSVGGLPLLSQIPVLGVLFGSHRNADTETEGAIYIVPSVLETPNQDSLELVESALSKFDRFKGRVDDGQLYPRRPR